MRIFPTVLVLALLTMFNADEAMAAKKKSARASSSKKSVRAAKKSKRAASSKKQSADASGTASGGTMSAGSSSSLPVGMVSVWSASRLPSGYLWCDGAEIPKDARYNALRAIVGERTPDMRGAFADKQPAATLNYVIKYE
ncbi:MAG: tail fiber protein [Rickettsiales bacterium]|nr:tail fiber protein [Rickettsiales bacterium]